MSLGLMRVRFRARCACVRVGGRGRFLSLFHYHPLFLRSSSPTLHTLRTTPFDLPLNHDECQRCTNILLSSRIMPVTVKSKARIEEERERDEEREKRRLQREREARERDYNERARGAYYTFFFSSSLYRSIPLTTIRPCHFPVTIPLPSFIPSFTPDDAGWHSMLTTS